MPIYEYECADCDKVMEVRQRISDPPLESCPECGGKVKKLVSVSSFQLKGGGWYADGYTKSPKDSKDSSSSSTQKKSTDSSPPCKKEGCKNCPAATTT